MKRLLLALGFALCVSGAQAQPGIIGPPNAIQCNKAAFATATSATTTSLIAGVAGQSIFICGWHVTSILSTTSTFTLEYGTQGGPCTTPTAITPAFNVTSTAPSSDHSQFATLQIPAANQLCVVTGTGATGTAVLIWYSQF